MTHYFSFIQKTITATALVLIAGCCPPPVLVPVSSCPQPPTITMPLLAVDQLPQRPDTATGLKALAVDHVTLKATLEQCIITLEGYKQ